MSKVYLVCVLWHPEVLLTVGDVAHEHGVDGHVEHLHEHGRRQPRDDHHQRRRRDRVVHLQHAAVSQ